MRRAQFILLALVFAGCQTAPSTPAHPPAPKAQPLAFVNGEPVTVADLRAGLFDIAGREALGELILDRAVAARGVTVTNDDVAAERRHMLTMLSPDPDEAARLLTELRLRRGLSDARFTALLRRNAALRKLVADQAAVTPAAIQQAYMLDYGPRYRGRVIVTRTLNRAAELRVLAMDQPFAELALKHSTDPSSTVGGLLPPISPEDDAYPKAIRDTLARLSVGQVSEPVSVEGGFAILKLEEQSPASDVPLERVRDELAARVRLRAERLLMDQLARELIGQASVVVLDGDLNRVWKTDPTNN